MDSLDAIENANSDDNETHEETTRNVGQEETSSELQHHLQTDTEYSARATHPISPSINASTFNNQWYFRKESRNEKLILYLINRDLIVNNGKIDKLFGVIKADSEYIKNKRVYGQVTLTFRYGREDEEYMGIKFCTEAIICFAQLYSPCSDSDHQEPSTALQDLIIRKEGPTAHAFSLEIPSVAPPSVHLHPAKEYNGAPIGTSYLVTIYAAERTDKKVDPGSEVRMEINVILRTNSPPVPLSNLSSVSPPATIQSDCNPHKTQILGSENEVVECDKFQPPHAVVEKRFLLNPGSIRLEVHLDRANYTHGEDVQVHVTVNNDSHKSVRRIEILLLQHVDVCMYKHGKFKNVVGAESERENCPLAPGAKFSKTYSLKPALISTKNWIALEYNYTKKEKEKCLASTIISPVYNEEDRNPYAINVSYYVQVKLLVSLMCNVVSVKLPFTLMRPDPDPELSTFSPPLPLKSPPVETSNANSGGEDKKKPLAVMETSIQANGNKVTTALVQVKQIADVNLKENNKLFEST
ncbi:phosrestin-2-like isoform X1 [Cotesia glomerata]|uniref:phosrestin-2-like isoform X1 n=1 Tax=Cotesia glomerata TaxID=32391 RepID=UPI001D00D68D|nr:phosrestin-2-like isoform X1 [Cotesia glomerata]